MCLLYRHCITACLLFACHRIKSYICHCGWQVNLNFSFVQWMHNQAGNEVHIQSPQEHFFPKDYCGNHAQLCGILVVLILTLTRFTKKDSFIIL